MAVTALVFGGFAYTADARSGGFVPCVVNDEYGDCLGDDFLEAVERKHWIEKRGGLPGPYPVGPTEEQVQVADRLQQIITLFEEVIALLNR